MTGQSGSIAIVHHAMEKNSPCAYVTLLTKPAYLPGILVLDHGLRLAGSRYPLVVMVTPGLSKEARDLLRKRNIRMRDVDPLRPSSSNLAFTQQNHDERFAETWTKLRVFQLLEFRRVVLLDCDMIIKRNMDDLFDIELKDDQIAAAYVCACNPRNFKHYPADWKPENCAYSAYSHISALPPHGTKDAPRPHTQLNSGTVILNPSKKLSDALFDYFSTNDKLLTYSFPDQDLLSAYFDRRWKPIPWYYNALRTMPSVHPDVWDDKEVRCVHYILSDKPWQSRRTEDERFKLLNSWWWQQFDDMAHTMESMDPEGWKMLLTYVDVSM